MVIFDELKSVAKVLQEAGKIEQYQQILDAQQRLLEIQRKNSDLEIENRNLKEKLKIKENLKYENNAYWIIDREKKDGPFCSRCWDVEKNTVRIKQSVINPSFYTCPECKTQVQTDHNYRPIFASRKLPESFI